jgi:hypothetical protein
MDCGVGVQAVHRLASYWAARLHKVVERTNKPQQVPKSLSIWITSNARPIVVAQEMAAKAISDLAWTPDGLASYWAARLHKVVERTNKPQQVPHVQSN